MPGILMFGKGQNRISVKDFAIISSNLGLGVTKTGYG